MERFYGGECEPGQFSPLTLAFLGDAVFEIFVRERLLVRGGSRRPSELQSLSAREVCCGAQAADAEAILPNLTEEETAVYRRGKNARPGHVPRNADPSDYHKATALEALFGYLYLCGKIDRLRELFGMLQNIDE